MKNISLLGSTGSIGANTLDVVASHPAEFAVSALAGGRNINLLKEQIERFRPRLAVVIDEEHAVGLKNILNNSRTTILSGADGYREAASVPEAHIVVSAIVGAAGLIPTLDAIDAGKDIALANKETLVMAGGLVLGKAASKGVRIIPVDSEHSAIFQCLQGNDPRSVRRVILTASGGPFLHATRKELEAVTPGQALKHPNWQMGRKISIDSATMMNKGFEVIEASWLFGLAATKIDVLVHPQSIVHSLVEYCDGSVIAQLGIPDMRIPIAYALSYPQRLKSSGGRLDLAAAGELSFLKPDLERFPALGISFRAAEAGGTLPAVLNAANEIAVTAFLEEQVGFYGISRVVEMVLARHERKEEPSLAEILKADRWARVEALNIIKGMTK
ncbi:MAG: 1-deoxy-D-xylulose-5-phosphate reductoisomerase [Syntrophobacterales bacterium]|nr:1-deoxy-D-xylulose-5-phosphate reductoisomerase [Syntrophobacterales bacterium]